MKFLNLKTALFSGIVGTLILFFLVAPQLGHAQTYGNEWINFNAQYVKVKVRQDGIYRVDASTLASNGADLSTIDPTTLKIYYRGEEQPIFVFGEGDGVLDATDYLYFYGEKNDGDLDSLLYEDPEDQSHRYFSIYTDESAYFITWGGNSGLRVTEYTDTDFSGLTPDSYFMHTAVKTFDDQWFNRTQFADLAHLSEYGVGEGWMSQNVAAGQTEFIVATPNQVIVPGNNPILEMLAFGKSDPRNPGDIVNGINHEFEVRIGPDQDLVASKQHRGYSKLFFRAFVSPDQIENNTSVYCESVFGAKGRHAVSYITITYPRAFNLSGSSTFHFRNADNEYVEFTNYAAGKSNPIIWDRSHGKMTRGVVSGSTLQFKLESPESAQVFITDETDVITIAPSSAEAVNFVDFNPAGLNAKYLIITHPSLKTGAENFRDYRTSPQGGGHDVQIAYMDQLYDQFYYGVHHPLAIRNYCAFLLDNQPSPAEHLLLLGRGQVYFRVTWSDKSREEADLVPTMGVPASDYLLTSGLNGTQLQPAINTGRVPARDNEDVQVYLDKLITYETAGNALWRKKQLQLVGGSDLNDNVRYNSFMNNYLDHWNNKFIGGTHFRISKQDAVSVDTTLAEQVQQQVNQGVGMVNYFGHGSALLPEIDLGNPIDYRNNGRYPIFYFSGCSLGNDFEETSLVPQFFFEEDKGAIAWMAGSTFGFENQLNRFASVFHSEMADGQYGETLGDVMTSSIASFQNPADNFNRAHCRNFLYFGDPALQYYAPELPDYIGDQTKTIIEGKEMAVDGDSLTLVVPIINLGKAVDDSIVVRTEVVLPNGTTLTLQDHHIKSVYNTKNIHIKFLYRDNLYVGNVRFNVTIDPENDIDELQPDGEFNNTLSYAELFQGEGITLLSPSLHQIVSTNNVELMVQNNNLSDNVSNVFYEVDTVPDFNSPFLIQSPVVAGQNINRYVVDLSLGEDSIDYFWRARIDKPNSTWQTGTFALIRGSENGWSQRYYAKFQNSDLDNMAGEGRSLAFDRTVGPSYGIETFGANYTRVAWEQRNIWIEDGKSFYSIDRHFNKDGIRLLFFNPNTEERLMIPNQFNLQNIVNWFGRSGEVYDQYYTIGEPNGTYEYNTTLAEHQDSLIDFLNNQVPDGYHVIAYSGKNTGIESWPEELLQAFDQFGASDHRLLSNDHPYILFGRKGNAAGSAVEEIPNYNDPSVEPDKSRLFYSAIMFPRNQSGAIMSDVVGPARNWKEAYWTMNEKDASTDSASVSIIGINKNGTEVELISNLVGVNRVDLSSISSDVYPQLRLKMEFFDEEGRTPMAPAQWTVLFDGIPEGTAGWVGDIQLSTDSIHAGEPISLTTSFMNISPVMFDSIFTIATLKQPNGTFDTLFNGRLKQLPNNNDSLHFHVSLETEDMRGRYVLNMEYNPNFEQAEKTLFNNFLAKPFYVIPDEEVPVFDVLFDGKRIFNREIVSPNTVITVKAKDENDLQFINDPEYFDIFLKYPGTDTFTQILPNDARVQFEPASEDQPIAQFHVNNEALPDGIFTLRANVSDAAGNEASSNDYEIDFEVINASSITNFYPYPNPFTTQTKFVFTLTGDALPDYLNIKIMTVTGKVIREINMDELGPLRVGDNITEFAWNGTDEFGDPVGNGVYLYQVTAIKDGKNIPLRATAGDSFFKNNTGKMYLMR
jgi:hypothetical protein